MNGLIGDQSDHNDLTLYFCKKLIIIWLCEASINKKLSKLKINPTQYLHFDEAMCRSI